VQDRRIVITGGAGFIGSNIARALAQDNEVVAIDSLLTGKRENLAGIEGRVRFVEGDINNQIMLNREFESADYVLHQAALPSVQRSVDDPLSCQQKQYRRHVERACGRTGLWS